MRGRPHVLSAGLLSYKVALETDSVIRAHICIVDTRSEQGWEQVVLWSGTLDLGDYVRGGWDPGPALSKQSVEVLTGPPSSWSAQKLRLTPG